MLPIARNRSFHVPHGLAAVAASVCLVLAFTSDISQRQDEMVTNQTEPNARVATTAEDPRPDPVSTADARGRDTLPPTQTTRWIPWFPGLRPGGG
ncbi:MAG: hypothetical protein V2J42_00375 [Wenzhouxiangella sp.]|jgi:hypothetical protein|nr:hypothetical protein [Wenzhouxiangella sp.]